MRRQLMSYCFVGCSRLACRGVTHKENEASLLRDATNFDPQPVVEVTQDILGDCVASRDRSSMNAYLNRIKLCPQRKVFELDSVWCLIMVCKNCAIDVPLIAAPLLVYLCVLMRM